MVQHCQQWPVADKPFFGCHRVTLFRQATQHPGSFLMQLDSLRKQICCGFIIRIINDREKGACSFNHGLLAQDKILNHVFCCRNILVFINRG